MSFKSWLASVKQPRRHQLRKAARRKPQHAHSRPGVERLEDRVLLDSNWTPVGPAPIVDATLGGRGAQTAGRLSASGRVTGIAADPIDPNTIFITAAGGGVWKTVDGGTTWNSEL